MDLFAPGAAGVLVLLGARMAGLLAIAPVFSSRVVPVRLRTALLVLLTALLHPAAMAYTAHPPRVSPASLAAEALIGFGLGLGAALFVGAMETAGDYLSIQSGLHGAAVLDPTHGSQVQVLAVFLQMLTLALLLSFDGHLVMLRSLAESLRALPVGSPVEARAGLASLVSAGGLLFSLGLRFAAPVMTAVLIGNAALAVLSRAAPQLNILGVVFPLQIGVGLMTLAACIPLFGAFFGGWEAQYGDLAARLLAALAGGAGGR